MLTPQTLFFLKPYDENDDVNDVTDNYKFTIDPGDLDLKSELNSHNKRIEFQVSAMDTLSGLFMATSTSFSRAAILEDASDKELWESC